MEQELSSSSTGGNGFIKSAILKEFSNLVIRDRINRTLQSNGDADFKSVDNQVLQLLGDIGITFDVTKENKNNLVSHLKEKLGLSKEEFNRLPQTSQSIPSVNIYKVLNDWINEGDENLRIVHRDFYGPGGGVSKPCFHMINGLQVPEQHGYLAYYRNAPHFINFSLEKHGVNISVDGDYTEDFFKELNERYKLHLIKELKGKIINNKLEVISLKEYRRDELIYPRKLEENIDDLLISFKNWHCSDKIDRWGYILIGRPGTGKTTIGGMLAKIKPADCTFIYCPAGEVDSSRQLNNLFEMARMLAPVVLQIDDVDLISKHRQYGESGLTSTLMENLDGLKENKKIFLLLTTNNPGNIEKAIINRAGRISGKIIFTGYSECIGELIKKGSLKYGLNLSDSVIEKTIAELPKNICDLTPDEAMNVCMRLHLLRGDKPISGKVLMSVIECVFDAFNNPEYQKCYLEYSETHPRSDDD